MIYLLLSAILLAQILIIVVLFIILNHLEAMSDFSKEDLEVKAETEKIKQARKRFPPQK